MAISNFYVKESLPQSSAEFPDAGVIFKVPKDRSLEKWLRNMTDTSAREILMCYQSKGGLNSKYQQFVPSRRVSRDAGTDVMIKVDWSI